MQALRNALWHPDRGDRLGIDMGGIEKDQVTRLGDRIEGVDR